MKELLVSLTLMCSLFGCTKTPPPIACDLSKAVSSLVSAQVVTQLTCKNFEAVKATIDAKLVEIKVCEAAVAAQAAPAKAVVGTMSSVGDVVCAPVIAALSAGALAQIPAEWGCTGGPLTDSLKAQLLAACIKAI